MIPRGTPLPRGPSPRPHTHTHTYTHTLTHTRNLLPSPFMQELDLHWVSEAVFYTLFASVIAWTFSPFLTRRPTFTTAGLFAAALPAFVLCQALRIASFMATWLPAPAPHCRAGTPTERLAPPPHWWGWVAVDVVRQSSMSCGDLIFSSHLIYVLGLTLVYTIWGAWKVLKAAAWTAAAAISLLIIASRKHYTVDVVIAWYTVPLAFHALRGTARWKRLAGRPDSGLPEVNEAAGVAGPSNGDGPVAVVVENGHGAPPGASSLNIGRASAKSESDGGGGRSRRWLGWLPGGRRAGGGA